MIDLMWVQTEPKSSILVDGVAKEYDVANYVSVDDNPRFKRMQNDLMKVYYNKEDGTIVVHGYVDNIDSAGRKIPFAFFMKEKNIFNAMTVLKNRLKSVNLDPPEEIVDDVLHRYVNQNFIPFFTRKKMRLFFLVGSLVVIALIVLWMFGNVCKTIDG